MRLIIFSNKVGDDTNFLAPPLAYGQLRSYTSWVGNSVTRSVGHSLHKKVENISQF